MKTSAIRGGLPCLWNFFFFFLKVLRSDRTLGQLSDPNRDSFRRVWAYWLQVKASVCNHEDSVDLTRRTSSESVVGMRAGFVSALPGEDCEHTGNHGSTVRRGRGMAGRNDSSRLVRLKGKKRWRQWLDHNHKFTFCLCVCVGVIVFFALWVFVCLFFSFVRRFYKNSAGHVPAREITISGGKKTKPYIMKNKKRTCYRVEENCQQVLLIGAYFIQCWCVVVLVHICLFNHPFFPLGGGV